MFVTFRLSAMLRHVRITFLWPLTDSGTFIFDAVFLENGSGRRRRSPRAAHVRREYYVVNRPWSFEARWINQKPAFILGDLRIAARCFTGRVRGEVRPEQLKA